MKCSSCGRDIPAGQLVCLCFEQRADEELARLAITKLLAGEGYLYMTPSPMRHLLPAGKRGLTFCGEKRYTQASTKIVTLGVFRKFTQADCCIACAARVTHRLNEAEKPDRYSRAEFERDRGFQ
jgi:hypothetical protein